MDSCIRRQDPGQIKKSDNIKRQKTDDKGKQLKTIEVPMRISVARVKNKKKKKKKRQSTYSQRVV